MLVAEGDEVTTGDPLLVIDPTETRKELADAQKGTDRGGTRCLGRAAGGLKAQSDLSAAQEN